jgi:hypothetical protein
MENEVAEAKPKEEELEIGDKFTKFMLGALAGFVVSLIVEMAYEKMVERNRNRKKETE